MIADIADQADLNPAACSARSALSANRPRTLHVHDDLAHTVLLFRRVLRSRRCAANGVTLREPFKPCTPATTTRQTFPDTSVTVTTVLLNVAWMWAIPLCTFFLTFFVFRL